MPNPNPMNARCGLEACDCEYTIGGLLRRLELISERALRGLTKPIGLYGTTSKEAELRAVSRMALASACQVRAECVDTCLCYVAGCEAERRPPGA